VAVDWEFKQGDTVVPVTGSGLYQLESGQPRLTLDLVEGDLPLRQFDSGLVPRQDGFPEITIAVAVNGFFCYDHAFEISAMPAPVIETGMTWGRVKGTYR
jgi:hypothetical protein